MCLYFTTPQKWSATKINYILKDFNQTKPRKKKTSMKVGTLNLGQVTFSVDINREF